MYVLIVRLRAMQDRGTVSKYQHYLLDHFSHKAEDKMVLLHGMSARGIRNRYLKDLFLQWRGILAAYDEGLVKGDAVLAAAVWRNLWKGQEDVDWEMVAKAVGWMRRCVRLLGEVGDAEVQGSAEEIFERARKGVKEMVGKESKGIREEPRAEEEGKVVPGSP